eukprot:768033-Hanusia_phi.AAC.3
MAALGTNAMTVVKILSKKLPNERMGEMEIFEILEEAKMFALLRANEQANNPHPQTQPHLFSREEMQYCDKHCEKYVNLWEANNHIYENPSIYENLNFNPNAWFHEPQP